MEDSGEWFSAAGHIWSDRPPPLFWSHLGDHPVRLKRQDGLKNIMQNRQRLILEENGMSTFIAGQAAENLSAGSCLLLIHSNNWEDPGDHVFFEAPDDQIAERILKAVKMRWPQGAGNYRSWRIKNSAEFDPIVLLSSRERLAELHRKVQEHQTCSWSSPALDWMAQLYEYCCKLMVLAGGRPEVESSTDMGPKLAPIQMTSQPPLRPIVLHVKADEVNVIPNGPAVAMGQANEGIKKSFDESDLDQAIGQPQARSGQAATGALEISPENLIPFSAEKRELVIYEDRITVCGIEVWRECAQPDLREALVRLSRKEAHGYVRIRGAKLNQELGRNASNPIARPIKDFCDRAAERLKGSTGLDCGRYDILASKGGYHFTEWMQVRVAGANENESAEPANEPVREPGEPENEPLNERQKWILEQIAKGVPLRLPDIVRHTRKNRSTINRDLKNLRDQNLVVTHADGYYVLGQKRTQLNKEVL